MAGKNCKLDVGSSRSVPKWKVSGAPIKRGTTAPKIKSVGK